MSIRRGWRGSIIRRRLWRCRDEKGVEIVDVTAGMHPYMRMLRLDAYVEEAAAMDLRRYYAPEGTAQ